MTFWEWFTVMGTTATIMGVFLTVYGILNGRSTRRLLREMHEEVRSEIRAMHENTMRVLERIEAGQREMRAEFARIMERMDETVRRMDETMRRMDETLKHIAELIVIEGERTRQAIRGNVE